jgi:hypothetical protein
MPTADDENIGAIVGGVKKDAFIRGDTDALKRLS